MLVFFYITNCRSFLELLKDSEQMELFHFFLQSRGRSTGNTETQLLFWMAVEDVKACMGNRKACNFKTKRIQQRFFGGRGTDSGECGTVVKASLNTLHS